MLLCVEATRKESEKGKREPVKSDGKNKWQAITFAIL